MLQAVEVLQNGDYEGKRLSASRLCGTEYIVALEREWNSFGLNVGHDCEMRGLEALFGRIGEWQIGKIFVGSILGVLCVLLASCVLSNDLFAKAYQVLDCLLQFLHINIIAFPLLDILTLLDLGWSRATGNSGCDHCTARCRL